MLNHPAESCGRPALAIVICFRNWGLDRLVAAIRSHFLNAELCGIEIEVIVSDYGSSNPGEVRSAIEPLGAKVVRTVTSEPWCRAASLNAGVRAATAECIITTDADIVFTPGTFPALLERWSANAHALYLVQCRDLPQAFGVDRINSLLDGDWENGIAQALQHAVVRPRWGMGGFAAFSPTLFSTINGYDERLKVWGGEDNDFVKRARRIGYPVRWLSAPNVSILHIWHEPTRLLAAQTAEGEAAMAFNRNVVATDRSVQRNLPRTITARRQEPLVSIVVPTHRRARLLWDSIASCLVQTFENFELLVVENGDSHEAEQVVRDFGDARLRYLYCPTQGAAAARNLGLEHSKGRYIVIHDDDDVMVSTRVEDHLAALKSGQHGTYCGWIDFDSESFEVVGTFPGKQFCFESVLCTGKVLTHGGLMLDRRIFSMYRYEESLAAGIDYGFILLLARNGLKLGHTGTFGLLRRLHPSNMTRVNAEDQKSAARRMSGIIRSEIDDQLYAKYRARASACGALTCSNETAALAELAALAADSAKVRRLDVLRGCDFGGGTIEGLSANFERLDSKILERLSSSRPLPIRACGFSETALIQMRLRAIALAAQRGRQTPSWKDDQ
ncbi:MAG TPA: glycosyltransferase [Pseudomonadales bacterium]